MFRRMGKIYIGYASVKIRKDIRKNSGKSTTRDKFKKSTNISTENCAKPSLV